MNLRLGSTAFELVRFISPKDSRLKRSFVLKEKTEHHSNGFYLLFACTFSVFIGLENFCTPIIPRLGVVWIWFPFPLMLQTLINLENKVRMRKSPTSQKKVNRESASETYRLLWIKIPWGRGHVLWNVRINLLSILINLSRSKTSFPCFLQFKLLPMILSGFERYCNKCREIVPLFLKWTKIVLSLVLHSQFIVFYESS